MSASKIMNFSTAFFCGAITEIPTIDFHMINLISTVIGYIFLFTNPIERLLYENHGSLTSKMKVFAHATYLLQLLFGTMCYLIPANAFEGIIIGFCSSLKEVTVPASVTRIDEYAFYSCTSLLKVNISGNENDITLAKKWHSTNNGASLAMSLL